MPKYLHCGEWNKNNKYILLTALFAILTYCNYGYNFSDFLEGINLDNNRIIINYIFRYLSLILFSFALYKYELHKNKIYTRNTEDNMLRSSSIRLIYNNSEENTKNKIIISPMFILLIMIIMVVQEISEDIFYKSKLRPFDFWMLELPLLSYLNLKYFKFKIYLHHKLVIYLNSIIFSIDKITKLIIFTKDGNEDSVFNYYKKNWGVIPLGIFSYLIIITSRAFALSEIKVLMQYKYFSPIKLLILYGIIGVIITTIIGIFSSLFECSTSLNLNICQVRDSDKAYLENFKMWKSDFKINFGNICLFLIGIITYFLNRLFYIFIIRNLTIIHVIFSNIVYSYSLLLIGFIYFLIKKINNENEKKIENEKDNAIYEGNIYIDIIISLIVYIIVNFEFLVYLEIIELDFCNLNYNLKRNITIRSIADYELKSENGEDFDNNLNDSFNSFKNINK